MTTFSKWMNHRRLERDELFLPWIARACMAKPLTCSDPMMRLLFPGCLSGEAFPVLPPTSNWPPVEEQRVGIVTSRGYTFLFGERNLLIVSALNGKWRWACPVTMNRALPGGWDPLRAVKTSSSSGQCDWLPLKGQYCNLPRWALSLFCSLSL